MYVLNDVRLDSRVRREAATLARAGYAVSVVGIPSQRDTDRIEREHVDGYEIIRVPIPRAWEERWRWLMRPWNLRRRGVGGLHRALAGGPRAWPAIPGAAARIGAGLTLAGLRRSGLAVARLRGWREDASGEPQYPPPGVRWLMGWWRSGILGWAEAAVAQAPVASLHHGHDLTGLPAALRGASRDGGAIVYDSHEIFLDAGGTARQPRWARLILGHLERRWSARAAALVTVNQAYATVLARRLHPRETVVVRNCPPRWEPPTTGESPLRRQIGLDPGVPVILYHGAFAAQRGIDELLDALLLPPLGAAHLVLLGYGARWSQLRSLATEGRFEGRLHVCPAVPPEELLAWVAGADVAAIPLQRSTLNHYLCTPNKLFESLAAGVPVVVSDFPVMRGIVYGDPAARLGAVCDPGSPRSIALALAGILGLDPADAAALRERCLRAAHERWNWETEGAKLIALYAGLQGF